MANVSVIDQVHEGDEIIEDGVEDDVLDIAVGDELDEIELESSQITEQGWTYSSSRTNEDSFKGGSDQVGVSSSDRIGVGGGIDEEDTEERGSRFRSERTNVIPLKGVGGTKSLNNIPNTRGPSVWDNERLPPPPGYKNFVPPIGGPHNKDMRCAGPMPPQHITRPPMYPHHRHGPFPGPQGFPPHHPQDMRCAGPMPPQHITRPPMYPHHHHGPFPGPQGFPPHHPQDMRCAGPMPPQHITRPPMYPHHHHGPFPGPQGFPPHHPQDMRCAGPMPPQHITRAPMYPHHHHGPFTGPQGFPPHHPQDMRCGGPMPPQHITRPPMYPHHHHGPIPGPQGFPPHHPQGYPVEPPPQSPPSRIVQFNVKSQLITVENQHFHQQGYEQNFGPPNNQFQQPPPHFNKMYTPNQFQPPPPHFNKMYTPNQFNPPQKPNFLPQNPHLGPNPPNYTGYTYQAYQPQNPPYQNYDNNYNSQQPVDNQYYPPAQPPQPQPPAFGHPKPQFPPPQNPFPNQPQNFRHPAQKQFQNNQRGSVMKRLAPRQPMDQVGPPKQMRFEHKSPVTNVSSNLPEIKPVDSLSDTTTKQDPEPEIEEDEETKQYRLKIAEQKALREKLLKEKENRRLAAVLEKQIQENQSENNTNAVPVAVPAQQLRGPKPVQMQQKPVHVQQPIQQIQPQHQAIRNLGRGRGHSVNRVIPIQAAKRRVTPSIQGTVYKIGKVRTKKGSIVTRKTPIATQGGITTPLTKTVNNQVNEGTTSILRGTNRRMVPTKNAQGRKLFTVQTTPLSSMPKTTPQPLVIDNKPSNTSVKVAAVPDLPDSSLVTIDNLSLNTTQAHLQKMAKQVGTLTTPIATQGGITTPLTKTVNNQVNEGTTSILRGTNRRMVPTKNAQGRTLFTVQTTPLSNMPKTTPQPLVIDNKPSNTSVKLAAVPDLPDSSLVTIDNLSLNTTQAHLQKMAKQVGTLTTPIATQGGITTPLTKTVNNQVNEGTTSILRGTNRRMVPTKNAQGRTLFTVQTTPLSNMPKTTPQPLVIDNKPSNMSVKVAAVPDLPDSSLVTIDNLSLNTTQAHLQKMAKQVGTLTTPIATQGGITTPLTKTVNNQVNEGTTSILRGTNRRMVPTKNAQGRTLFTVQTTPLSSMPKTTPQPLVIDNKPSNTSVKVAAVPDLPDSSLVTIDNLSLNTTQAHLQKMAKQVGTLTTPIATQGGITTPLTKTVNNQANEGTTSILRGTNRRMVPTKNAQGRTLFTVQTTPLSSMPKTTPQPLVIDNKPSNTSVKVAAVPDLPDSSLVTIDNLSLNTTQAHLQKMAKQVGTLTTPIATQGGITTTLTKTVNNQVNEGTTSILRGTNRRMVPTKNAQGRTLFTVQTTPLPSMPKTTTQPLVIDNKPSNTSVKVAAVPDLPDSSLVTIDNLSLNTTQAHLQKMAKQVGTLTSFYHEPEQKKATLRFQNVQEAKDFHNKFNGKMIDLSRILVTVVPE